MAVMFPFLKKYFNKKQLYGLITNDLGNSISVIVVDSVTNLFVKSFSYKSENVQILLDEIPALKSIFKAFIIDLSQLQPTPYKMGYAICEELKEKFEKEKIPNFFISQETLFFTYLLISAKIELNFDDTVLLILPYKNTKLSKKNRTNFNLIVGLFKFTQNGYQLIKHKYLPSLNIKATPEFLRHQICDSSTPPENIIVSTFHCKKLPFKKIFKTSKNLVIFNDRFDQILCIPEICKWLLDKSFIKYHILPVSDQSFHIYGYYGSSKNILDILKIEMNEPLPLTKTAVVTKSLPDFRVMSKDKTSEIENFFDLPKNVHSVKIIIQIDEENFTNIDIEELAFKNFETLPEKFNTLLKPKIPVIGFFDNSSFIALCKNDGYEFLKEWNGMFGTDCFISFDQKKPKYGENAMEVIKTKHTFVVFDLLKIMSMPKDKIKIDKTWGFTITKDSEHPVLLEFDNFDGTKKRATPEFLMALFLRQHFKAIETEVGEKPKNIAFWILGNKFTEAEIQRIKEGLEESCKLLRIDCSFIDLPDFEYDYEKSCVDESA